MVATINDPVETGSTNGTLTISKAKRTITLGALPPKTYRDAPFTVSATSTGGLDVIRWESSDPSVATLSPGGEVTLVGAGQTSIIASDPGDSNYNAAWAATPLNVARSMAPLPSGTRSVVYDDSAQGLDPTALPSGLATEITYQDTRVVPSVATPEVVFQNGPDTLDLSYFSTGLQSSGVWGMAKYMTLGGTARKLDSCDVTLVSWARYDTSSPYGCKPWADAHPEQVVPPTPGISVPGNSGGYYHPVTLAFYEYTNEGTESYRLLTSQTVQALIPWRPVTKADGTAYPYNGSAFRVSFSFPDGVVLPRDVWVGVSFSTSTFGTAPVGAPGPYDSLNIPFASGQQAGSTMFDTYALTYKDWRWQTASGSGGPMLRLRALPANTSFAAPVNAGTYEVKTQATAFGSDGRSTSTLVIDRAPLAFTPTNLTQVRDGDPKPVTVTTTPEGISTSVTYGEDASPDAPSALGTHTVNVSSANPNYQGQATYTLQIGDTFDSWQRAAFASSSLPPEQTTDAADPDGDGLDNFLEYASNLNPLLADNRSPASLGDGPSLFFTYRRNLHALDLFFTIQHTTQLADPLSWAPVTPLSETTVFDDGSTKVIRATLQNPTNPSRYFLRLNVRR